MTNGSRVLEKNVNGAQVSNTVFNHLKQGQGLGPFAAQTYPKFMGVPPGTNPLKATPQVMRCQRRSRWLQWFVSNFA